MGRLYVLNGQDIGESFHLKEGANYIGRSPENEIPIKDGTVSRRHLRIVREGNRYSMTDLGSRNGTFFEGNYLAPGIEVEIKEGIPIAIAMTIIGIGESSQKHMMPFLDSVGLTKETWEGSGVFIVHRDKTNQKKLELIYRISDLLVRKTPLRDRVEKLLELIIEFLVRIDRAILVLVDPETTKVTDFFYRMSEPKRIGIPEYSLEAVYRVIKRQKSVVISDSRAEAVEDELASSLRIKGIASVMCIPVIGLDRVLGALYLDSLKKPYGFGPEDVSLFQDIAQRVGAHIHYERLHSESSQEIEDLSQNHEQVLPIERVT